MPHLLGRFKADAAAWKKMMAEHELHHREAGMRLEQVWTNLDDPEEIVFLFHLDDLARARAFLDAAGALDREKQKRGDIPKLFFLEEA